MNNAWRDLRCNLRLMGFRRHFLGWNVFLFLRSPRLCYLADPLPLTELCEQALIFLIFLSKQTRRAVLVGSVTCAIVWNIKDNHFLCRLTWFNDSVRPKADFSKKVTAIDHVRARRHSAREKCKSFYFICAKTLMNCVTRSIPHSELTCFLHPCFLSNRVGYRASPHTLVHSSLLTWKILTSMWRKSFVQKIVRSGSFGTCCWRLRAHTQRPLISFHL